MRQAWEVQLGWIWADNLRPRCIELALLVGYASTGR